ncbi:unnamed protein product [Acanthoscelides obtectus]|uniref:Glutamine amidotransferase type-2 domain-containing protein n=2 Tax=Acanthoscelides obtectus TaxID=200917 RepID=A0A9P0KUW2_ACAOB|nr:unnamed protein product [Acanthoscelides obtectus]CAK1684500.1 Asparagine synthetase domain-containing protein 1 [Acanthoscelides obtectus]
MCGIICVFSNNNSKARQEDLTKILQIFENTIKRRGPNSYNVKSIVTSNRCAVFAASVLWLQGQTLTDQPVEDYTSLFVYNGDIFSGIPEDIRLQQGDTVPLLNLLKSSANISGTLSKIAGPYAFIYLDKSKEILYFGRDVYGRRSLLIGKNDSVFILCSVAKRKEGFDFVEVPSIGTFCWNLRTGKMIVNPWQDCNKNFDIKLEELSRFLKCDISIQQILPLVKSINSIDCKIDEYDMTILQTLGDVDTDQAFCKLLGIQKWQNNMNKLEELLKKSIKVRVSNIPNSCSSCLYNNSGCIHARIGVLYSGGVDCSILAALLDRCTDRESPIDLINVAFDKSSDYNVPDRITGLEGLNELRLVCPDREWNFLSINVPQEELNSKRSASIADLIYPLTSILDDSLGCALWFAARGKQDDVTSSCRVLLVGMGADELFGGYTRHRAAFARGSWSGLNNVLNEDWQNLSHRNLGRDDRVVSDHGRQLRTPYLDEEVVNFVRGLKPWEKTFPSKTVPQGFGEKLLLRCLAYKLGLKKVARFKKRALQFGSRIANKNEKAHEMSKRLVTKI